MKLHIDNWEELRISLHDHGVVTTIQKTVPALTALLKLFEGRKSWAADELDREFGVKFETGSNWVMIYSEDELIAYLNEIADVFTPISFEMSWREGEEEDAGAEVQSVVFGFDTIVGTGTCNWTEEDDGVEDGYTFTTLRWESVWSPSWHKFVTGFANCDHDYGSYGDRLCIHHLGFDILCYFRDPIQNDLSILRDFITGDIEKEEAGV